jgi:excisionase family DNA binding protein
MPGRKKSPSTLPKPLYFTIPEIATLLCLGRTKVYDLIKREGLPTVKFGTSTRVPAEKFQKWCEQRESA